MADITVIKTITETIDYQIATNSFNHAATCPKWGREFGKAIRVAPNGKGFIPAKLFLSRKYLNKIITQPLEIPWSYCPYCGHKFTVEVSE